MIVTLIRDTMELKKLLNLEKYPDDVETLFLGTSNDDSITAVLLCGKTSDTKDVTSKLKWNPILLKSI